MELVTPEPKKDSLRKDLEEVYEYICDGRVYKARETLEGILGIKTTDPDLA
jgi:hypothetical protein